MLPIDTSSCYSDISDSTPLGRTHPQIQYKMLKQTLVLALTLGGPCSPFSACTYTKASTAPPAEARAFYTRSSLITAPAQAAVDKSAERIQRPEQAAGPSSPVAPDI